MDRAHRVHAPIIFALVTLGPGRVQEVHAHRVLQQVVCDKAACSFMLAARSSLVAEPHTGLALGLPGDGSAVVGGVGLIGSNGGLLQLVVLVRVRGVDLAVGLHPCGSSPRGLWRSASQRSRRAPCRR